MADAFFSLLERPERREADKAVGGYQIRKVHKKEDCSILTGSVSL
jgi:hypothetical protein